MIEVHRISLVIPVYRDATRAIALAKALALQRLPHGHVVQMILVDDGSGDGTADEIDAALASIPDAKLIRLEANAGRSIARNAGARASEGEVLLFIDCDCLPIDARLLTSHLSAMQPGVVATTGPVMGNDDGFWHRYQVEASERRARWHASGIACGGSSQNMMVRRDVFLETGGFDPAFKTYGFEDRDLLLRLTRWGRIAWAADAAVKHTDVLDMQTVSRKMREAGGEGARLFSGRHPDAYRKLGYDALDTRRHWWLAPVADLCSHALDPLANWVDRVIRRKSWPYAIKRLLVRSTAGLSYLVGTRGSPR